MIRRSLLLLALLAASTLAFAVPHTRRSSLPTGPLNEVYPDKILIKIKGLDHGAPPLGPLLSFVPDVTRPGPAVERRISQRLGGAQFISAIPRGGWTLWQLPPWETFEVARANLRGAPDVITVQHLNRVYHLSLPVPNDPDWAYIETDPTYVLDLDDTGQANFRRLWHLWDLSAVTDDSGGVVSGGWATYPGTWYTAATKPRNAPMIAFVDTGLDMDHPDFINSGGTGTDVTQGGQINKALSAYFLLGQVQSGSVPQDINGHGTHVTGIAVAAGNNGSFNGDGVIGIGYNSQAMILRVFDENDNASDMNAAAAIYYAADHGADIINLSLGTTNYSQVFQDSVTYAWQKGSLVICAGNENGNGGGNLGPIYPAACSGALAVTANGPGEIPADTNYAGYGSYVGIAAPGGDLVTYSQTEFALQYVYSTACRQACSLSQNPNVQPPYTLNYTYLVGTSMACPNVSGAAGLLYGELGLSQAQGYANVRAYEALEATADPSNGVSGGGWEPTQGYGSLDVASLLDQTNPNPRGATIGSLKGIVYYNGTAISNVAVNAVGNGQRFSTTTLADGTYRFDGIPGNAFYTVTVAPFGAVKSRVVSVPLGADFTGEDFFCGTYFTDTTPPTVALESFVGSTANSLDINQWAYDTESEIDFAKIAIGSTYGGTDIMAAQPIYPTGTHLHLTGFTLPHSYFATTWYTNGAGLTARALVANRADAADGYVVDHAYSDTTFQNPYLFVAGGAPGPAQVAYLQFDISATLPNIKRALLTAYGAAATPVLVGAYATNAATLSPSTLTYNTKPSLLGAPVSTATVRKQGTQTWDVTSAVLAAKSSGASSVVIALACPQHGPAVVGLVSQRGNSAFAPALNISSNE